MLIFLKKKIYKFIIKYFYDRVEIEKKKIICSTQSKKNYYIICNLNALGGIFSNLKMVLNGIVESSRKNLKPEVDMENYPTLYNDTDIKFTKNSWIYYFRPLSSGLKHAHKNGFIVNKNNQIKHKILIKNKYRNKKLKKIFKKFIFFNKKLIELANNYYKTNLYKKKNLAIHIRGTDAKITPSHNFPPTIDQIFLILDKEIKKNKIEKIFLITDQLQYLKILKKKYKKKICYINSFRSDNTKIFNLKIRRKHNYKIGRDSIIEMLVLSKINNIIYSQSNLVEFAIFLSSLKKIKVTKIENGKNSKNILISLFLWKIKKYMSESFGGFKKNAFTRTFYVTS